MRLFVSVDLPHELAEPVADLQDEFADAGGLNFTDPEQAHVTMKFLGDVRKSSALSSQPESQSDSDDVDEDRLPELERELEAAVEDADIDPFTARFGGLGVFPSLEYITVVWFGVEEGGEELTQLHEAIEERTTGMGFEAESHDFTPHVTLARMEHAGGKDRVQDFVRETTEPSPDDERQSRDPTIGEMTVDEIRLTESTLTDDGPVYSTVESFSLE